MGPINLVNTTTSLGAHPNSEQYLANNAANAVYLDTTYDVEIQIQARVTTLTGSVNSPRLYPSYSTDNGSNWTTIGTGADLTNFTGDALTLASTGHKITGWITLPGGAIGSQILFRVTQNGGNSSANPAVANCMIQTRK